MVKHLQKIILAAIMLFVTNEIWAYSFRADGNNYYFNITSNSAPFTVEITNSGSGNPVYSGNFTIPSSVTYNGITYTVTGIGNGAFSGCQLTSITIPNTVTYIAPNAFYASSLLRTVEIPNSVTSIGQSAFQDCASLTSVTIGNAVSNIGTYSFAYTSLSSIVFLNSNTTIAGDAFSGVTVSIPVYIPCGATSWYRNQLRVFSNFIETVSYNYFVESNDTIMGHVTTDTIPTCNNNSSWTIRATANNDYHFSFWSDGDSNIHRTITVNKDTNIIAHFAPNPYSVIVTTCDSSMGIVFGSGRFQFLSQVTIYAVANYGYNFSHWSDGDTNAYRTITLTKDTNLTAYFVNKIYAATVLSNDTIRGIVYGSGSYSYLSHVTLTATSFYGYSFSHWSDGDTNSQRIITITQDTIITAYFIKNIYIVGLFSNNNNWGSVLGGGRFSYLSQATLYATADSGYSFLHWSDGDTTNPRIITITQDTVLIAHFTQTTPQPWYNFVVVSEDTNKGTVQIVTQPTQASPQALIVALPKTGYSFAHWSDGNMQNPRALTVTQDTILIAFFTSNQGIAEADNDNISIRSANGHILLKGISDERVYMSDVLGRVIYSATVNEKAEIPVRKRGVYFVKVGNRMARKVVVVR